MINIDFTVTIYKQFGNSIKLVFQCAELGTEIFIERNPNSGIWEGPYAEIGRCLANTLEELEDFEALVARTASIMNVLTMDVKDTTYNDISMLNGITVVTLSTDVNNMLVLS